MLEPIAYRQSLPTLGSRYRKSVDRVAERQSEMRERLVRQAVQLTKRKLVLRCGCSVCSVCKERERVRIATAAYRERHKTFLGMRWAEYASLRIPETVMRSKVALGSTGVAFMAAEMLLANAGKEFRGVYLSEIRPPAFYNGGCRWVGRKRVI